MTARPAWAIPALALVGASLPGCKAPAGGRAPPLLEFLATVPAAGSVQSSDLHLRRAGRWVYAVADGDGAGGVVTLRQAIPAGPAPAGAAWLEGPGPSDLREEFWWADGEGNVLLTAVIEHADRAITFFDPPLVVARARLDAGDPQVQQVSMRVVDLDDPSRPRESGTAVQKLEYIEDQRFRTEAGEMTAKRVDATFEAKLRLAQVRTVTSTWVVPGFGPVVRRTEHSVRSMGIPIRRQSRTLLLQSPAAPRGAPADARDPHGPT